MAILANSNMKKAQQIPPFMEKYFRSKLRIGFSGGADSTALLLLLLNWGWNSRTLEAVHFEHGLRGSESIADALWCENFCRERQIKFTLVKLDLTAAIANGDSIEDAARRARLDWYIANDDHSPVVLAHHGDDADENIFLKLARGANVSTLASLRQERKLWNLTILRPLLDWRKDELEKFLLTENISDWRQDCTNAQNDYHRNFLRNKLLPQWGDYCVQLKKSLEHSRAQLALDADFIEQCAAGKLQELRDETGACQLITGVGFWSSLHPALLARVLRAYCAAVSGTADFSLTQGGIAVFRQALTKPESGEKKIIDLGGNCFFELKKNQLHWKQMHTGDPADIQQWHWRENAVVRFENWVLTAEILTGAVHDETPGCFYFDADKLPEVLYLTYRCGGEYMHVWGSDSARRVKHLLSGVPDKEDIFLLRDAEKTIYLLGSLRRSIHAPVDCRTNHTVKLTIQQKKRQ